MKYLRIFDFRWGCRNTRIKLYFLLEDGLRDGLRLSRFKRLSCLLIFSLRLARDLILLREGCCRDRLLALLGVAPAIISVPRPLTPMVSWSIAIRMA